MPRKFGRGHFKQLRVSQDAYDVVRELIGGVMLYERADPADTPKLVEAFQRMRASEEELVSYISHLEDLSGVERPIILRY